VIEHAIPWWKLIYKHLHVLDSFPINLSAVLQVPIESNFSTVPSDHEKEESERDGSIVCGLARYCSRSPKHTMIYSDFQSQNEITSRGCNKIHFPLTINQVASFISD